MPIQHPTDHVLAALIDGRLPDSLANEWRSHIRDCQRCQLRAGAAGESLLGDDDLDFEAVPIAILDESVPEMPDPGELWRLTWNEITALAVIWRVDLDRLSVLPIVDLADADDWSALLHPEVTGRFGALAVSVALETTVPWSVLSACLTRLADTDSIQSLRTEFRLGSPSTSIRGERVRSPLDERIIGLETTAEVFNELANANWAIVPSGPAAAYMGYERLIDIGIDVNRALAISARGASPTDEESRLIRSATGVWPGVRAVDDDLRRKIDKPRRKAAIRARANASKRDEGAERLVLARLAEPALTAARGTRGAPPDYDTVLDQLLNA